MSADNVTELFAHGLVPVERHAPSVDGVPEYLFWPTIGDEAFIDLMVDMARLNNYVIELLGVSSSVGEISIEQVMDDRGITDPEQRAEKVFLDGKHDVALIKISPDEIPEGTSELAFDCDYSLSRGNRVFSLGHPEGQDFTVSFGVLSGAKDFHVDGSYFTTDLVTEPGSSGGPVVLAETGSVIGMTTAGFDESDIGFITKSSDICPILNLVRERKNPSRPRFGFQTMVVDKELSPTVGAVFDNTLPVKIGDEILSWNGNLWSPREHGDLGDAMRGYSDDAVQLTLVRDGQETSLSVPVTVGRSIHEKEWIYFTGLTITEDVKADARYVMGNTSAPLLHIETIDTDFNDTEDVEFYRGVDIASVGGVSEMDLKALYQMLSEWPEESEIRVVARVFDWTPESYSHLMSHSFTVKDLDCSWCPEKP